MRKIRRNRRKSFGMASLTFLFLGSLVLIGTGYSLLSQDLQIKGKTTIAQQTTEEEKIKFTYVTNKWGVDPYTIQYDVTLENISDETFSNWTFYVPVPEGTEVLAAWNVIATIENGKLVLKNESYNANIGIDAKLTFGIQLSTFDSNLELENPFFESENEENSIQTMSLDVSDLSAEYKKTQSWQDDLGYHNTYETTIKNNGSTVSDWRLEVEKNEGISLENAWNANYVEQEDQFVFTNVAHNGTIDTNGSVTFNLVILSKDANYTPKTISISGTTE